MSELVTTTDDWIQAQLPTARSEPGEKLISTVAGTTRVRTRRQEVVRSPIDGRKVMFEHAESGRGLAISEMNGRRHANVRPMPIRYKVAGSFFDPDDIVDLSTLRDHTEQVGETYA